MHVRETPSAKPGLTKVCRWSEGWKRNASGSLRSAGLCTHMIADTKSEVSGATSATPDQNDELKIVPIPEFERYSRRGASRERVKL